MANKIRKKRWRKGEGKRKEERSRWEKKKGGNKMFKIWNMNILIPVPNVLKFLNKQFT